MKYQSPSVDLVLHTIDTWMALMANNDDVVWKIICRQWIFVESHSTLKIS